MTWPAAFFFPHVVKVEDLIRSGGMGERHGDPRDVGAEVLDEQRLVRNAEAQEVVSSTQVTVPLDADVRVGSMVTVWPGAFGSRRSQVLAVARNENPPPLPSFLVLSLE